MNDPDSHSVYLHAWFTICMQYLMFWQVETFLVQQKKKKKKKTEFFRLRCVYFYNTSYSFKNIQTHLSLKNEISIIESKLWFYFDN